jgi:C-terminal processing protease CtpA/Prc
VARWQVMSVTELMDENGDIINERVGLGDELVEINGVHVSTMVVGEVIQRVSGAVDTLVRMTFRNNRESREYSVTARRHVPINAPRGSSAAAQQPVPNRYV